MDILEYFYEHPPQIEKYVNRKFAFPETGHLNLCGARGSGKTALVSHYLQESPYRSIYIDLEDPALILHTLDTLPLQDFIDEYRIEELIFDHYEEGMLDDFPNVKRMILVSRTPVAHSSVRHMRLFPLDFEEFLGFERVTDAAYAFSRFLKKGTLPSSAMRHKPIRHLWKSFFQHQFSATEQSLLIILATHNAQSLTTHQIYTFAKEHFKISKTVVYETIERFQREGIVYFVENILRKSGKKAIFYDFAFAKYLAFDQNFGVQFDTMVALALIKHGLEIKALGIHGYLIDSNILVIPAPFESEEQLWLKAQQKFSLYKQHGIRTVQIVTVNNAYRFEIESIRFEAIPFREWSIVHRETD